MIEQEKELDLASYMPGECVCILYHNLLLNYEDAVLFWVIMAVLLVQQKSIEILRLISNSTGNPHRVDMFDLKPKSKKGLM
jgi:hypothetical protein